MSIAPGIALMLAPYMQNVLPVSRADQIREVQSDKLENMAGSPFFDLL